MGRSTRPGDGQGRSRDWWSGPSTVVGLLLGAWGLPSAVGPDRETWLYEWLPASLSAIGGMDTVAWAASVFGAFVVGWNVNTLRRRDWQPLRRWLGAVVGVLFGARVVLYVMESKPLSSHKRIGEATTFRLRGGQSRAVYVNGEPPAENEVARRYIACRISSRFGIQFSVRGSRVEPAAMVRGASPETYYEVNFDRPMWADIFLDGLQVTVVPTTSLQTEGSS